MALTDAQWAAAVADIVADLVADTITAAQASARLAAATEDWPTRSLSNADLAARVSRFLARLNGLILTEGPPDAALGELNTFAYDTVNGALYGPKTLAGWGVPVSLVGPGGPAGVISGATIAMLAPDLEPTVTLGGTPSDRSIAFGIPAARDGTDGIDGDDGVTPNVSAEVTMIAAGQPAVVTRSGPDATPVFTFQIPRMADGQDGKTVEMQRGVTHVQWRNVGSVEWINIFALAEAKGDRGEKGDAFEFDAKPADLAGRAAYDAEPEGFTVLVMDTGTVYARVGAAPGVWSDGFPFGQTQNAILEALSALSAAPGLLYQEDGTTFSKRAIGAASDADVLDRQAADGRYRQKGQAVPMADITGLGDALDEKANAAAVLASLGGKQDKLGFTPADAADLPPAWHVESAAYAATRLDRILADTSAAAWSLTLPADGVVQVRDAAGTWPTHALTIIGPIRGCVGDLICDQAAALELVRPTGADEWIVSKFEGVAA